MSRKKRSSFVQHGDPKYGKTTYHPEYYANGRVEKDWAEELPPKRVRNAENDLPEWMNDEDPDMPRGGYGGYRGRGADAAIEWQAPVRSGWTTGENPMDKIAKDCSHCEKSKPEHVILLDQRTTEAIKWLMENKNVEWQMLLKGDISVYPDGDVVTITGYVVPKQVVSGATVKNIDCIDKKFIEEQGIVCTIHSHVSMGAFFSGTDVTECNSGPIKYHIVMNNRYEYQSVKQITLPCGMLKFQPCDVVLWGPRAAQPTGFENIEGGQ